MTTIAFVSVAQKYEEGMTVSELAEISYGFWACSTDYVYDVVAVIPVYKGEALMAFQNRGALKSDYAYRKRNGALASRTAFSLGDAIPIHNIDATDLPMRSGIVVRELELNIKPFRR